jgi:hypothetical protein
MQDKDLHINKKFTDRAWADMRRLLDEELPSTERRRRFGWWWVLFGLAAFLTTGTAAVLYFSKKNQSLPSAPVKIDQPVALENKAQQATATLAQPTQSTESTATGSTAASIHAPQAGDPTTGTEGAARPGKTGPSAKALRGVGLPQPAGKSIEKSFDMPENNSEPTILETMEALVDIEKEASEGMGHPLLPAEKIPGRKLASLDYEATFDSKLNVPSPPKSAPIELSAYMGGLATPLNKANGADAGIAIGLPLGKSRFTLEGGPEYAFVQQPLFVLVAQSPANLEPSFVGEEEVIVSVNNEKISTESSQSYNSVTRVSESLQMHYANFPLSLKYKASPRISFHGGMNLGILLASSPGYTNGGVLRNLSDKNLADEYNINADQLRSSGISLSGFDFSATGGVRYRLNYHLELDFQYRLGMRDLILSNTEKEYNRFFNLSLHYRLLGKN